MLGLVPALAAGLIACAPVILGGGVVTGVITATDRRPLGIQWEDRRIQSRTESEIERRFGERVHVRVTSHNLQILLTGEVPDEAARREVETIVRAISFSKPLRSFLEISGTSSTQSRANDAVLELKVRATLTDDRSLYANAIVVVAERGDVFLMGIVSEAEAARAAELVRSVPGVLKVVRVFEIISDAELERLRPQMQPRARDPYPDF